VSQEQHATVVTIREALTWGYAVLNTSAHGHSATAQRDCDDSSIKREAQQLLAAACQTSTAQLIAWPDRLMTDDAVQCYRDWISRRNQGEPIAYILKRRDFWDLTLRVTPATLIPRPETEGLIEWALRFLPATQPLYCADLGTGSGALAIVLARARPHWTILALDCSLAALRIAQYNAALYGVNNLWLLCAHWLSACADHCLDVIIANPPYIAAHDHHLEHGDVRFEPRVALIAGADGLTAIQHISTHLNRCLKSEGWCAIEHGWDQAPAVATLLQQQGLTDIHHQRDLADIDRITTARR
jgi:release factor glutamine methyltransferase